MGVPVYLSIAALLIAGSPLPARIEEDVVIVIVIVIAVVVVVVIIIAVVIVIELSRNGLGPAVLSRWLVILVYGKLETV